MKRRLCLLGALVGVLLTLSGCYSKSVEELYYLPKMPEDYVELDTKIKSVMNELSVEYTSPTNGSNTATVQLQDLDGDGRDESTIAFFRANSGEQPLKIYIFQQNADNGYDVVYTIEGDGESIHSISYVDLNYDGAKEIVISWRMSSSIYTLSAYQMGESDAIELMSVTYNGGYTICDLNRDNRQELMVMQTDDTGQAGNRADYYAFVEEQLTQVASAPLSFHVETVGTVRTGYLKDYVPAVYVASQCGDATVTDVLALRDGELTNITLDEHTGMSTQTLRYYVEVSATDVNSDGVLELPSPFAVQEYQSSSAASNFWIIRWLQFDINGDAEIVRRTYHNFTDGWNLTIPEEWEDEITISRDDSQTIRGERAVVFSKWDGDEDHAPQDFLRVYRLEGTNRNSRAKLGSRFVLYSDSKVIYTAEFMDIGWDCGMDQQSLTNAFSLIRKEWTNQ